MKLSKPPTPHYQKYMIEPIDVIVDWGLDFIEGNIVKLIARRKHKGQYMEDTAKILQYARWLVEIAVEEDADGW